MKLTRLMSAWTVVLILFDLVNDSSPMGLCGKILEWCKAYDILVESFVIPLFAWIHLGWISVSSFEINLLVIQGILSAATALTFFWHYKGEDTCDSILNFLVALFTFFFSFCWSLVPALLSSSWLGAFSGAIVGWLFTIVYSYGNVGMASEWPSLFAQGIAFIAVLACWAISLNHILYSH
jgi:hypothetical protein